MRFIICTLLFLNSCRAFGTVYTEEVYDNNDQYVGEVWTDDETWKICDIERPCLNEQEEPSPLVCMEYSNTALIPIVCRLTVSALLTEPFTGFIKVVTDTRDEIVFYNQTHQVCFNFAKDEYKLWSLIDTSAPKVQCFEWDEYEELI